MNEDHLHSLIKEIYAAPGVPDAWQHLTRRLATAFRSAHCHLVVMGGPGRISCDYTSEVVAGVEYSEHYAALDTGVHRLLAAPDFKAITAYDVMSPEEMRACPVIHEMLPRYGITHRLWSKSGMSGHGTCATAIMRTPGLGSFGADEYRLLEQLQPHLERAMYLHLDILQARETTATLAAGFDTLRSGVLLLDSHGTLIFANKVARALLDDRSTIRLEQGKLTASRPGQVDMLAALVGSVLRGNALGEAGALALPRSRGAPLRLRIMPVDTQTIGLPGKMVAALLIDESSPSGDLDVDTVSALFGLTPAEARVAVTLAEGHSVEEIAALFAVSTETVRSQLKRAMAKCDVQSQAALVSRLLRA